ncbi:MAG TPA: hypothetical protein VN688_12165 [Gemmataceae bacterium]|nr:hypothetical protein [Gemmataceae bacterium]
MFAHCHRTLLVVPLLLAVVVPADAAAPAPKPTAKQIAQWIEQLGDNSFAVREQASKKLWAAGQAAEPALEKAIKSDDAEVVRRARDLLDKFRWGIYPDTPAEIAAGIQAYQSSEGNQRLEALQRLLQAGSTGLKAVLKISKAEKDPNQRKTFGQIVSSKLPSAFARVLETNNYEEFEGLLEGGHDNEIIDNQQYAAYWLLRGKLDERITRFRSLLAKTPAEKRLAETLIYLYRAKGDLTAARKAAEKAERGDLIEGILYEAADWKALAARPGAPVGRDTVEKLAYQAAFARLAGNQKDFETFLGDLRKLADQGPGRGISSFAVAKAFLVNDRPIDGLALLAKTPDRHAIQFEILCARLQYGEAMKLVAQTRPADSKEQKLLEILQARTLYMLGEKDKAQALFTRLAEQIKDNSDAFWVSNLLETEYRIGLIDQAFKHCAKAMSDGRPKGEKLGQGGTYLSKVFPNHTQTAEAWWELLRQKFKDETSEAVLKRLRKLMDGKIAAKDVKAWIEEADGVLSVNDGRHRRNDPDFVTKSSRQWQAMAEVATMAGLDDLARSLLEKADTPEALLQLGDMLARKKQWTKAAERYRQAWRKSLTPDEALPSGKQSDPLPLYLAGDALVKAGQDKEGKELIERSHWLLLADAKGRFAFLRALAQRGHMKAAQRETELLSRVSEPNTYYSGAAIRRLAVAAIARKDYLKAAEGFEQSMLRCLNPYTNFVQPSGYANVPAQVHQLRARGLFAAGKFAEAHKQIELAQACSPGNVELPITLVPALEKGGHKKEATALFEKSFAAYAKVSQDYPRCAWAHNSAAWMAACCRRNLDKALEHAGKAVELAPTNAGYIDTLAEVHFQRGEKDKAIALQKRAIEIDPKKSYYRKQLRRLEAGDPAAERPLENDE